MNSFLSTDLSSSAPKIIVTENHDPWLNLAAEEAFFASGGPLLFLWQNAATVVIGRHQNAWSECRLSLLEAEGCRLARRKSGGGAVFHDLGNLNFTFIARDGIYDPVRQTGVILAALRSLQIDAVFSGRNDLTLASGEKFSGNAYWSEGGVSCHHGTLLVSVDMEKLSHYLSPPEAKYVSKGIASVRSRVVNLSDIRPGLTIASAADALCGAFEAEYGPSEQIPDPVTYSDAALAPLFAQYASDAFRLGPKCRFTCELSAHLTPGHITLCFDVDGGTVRNCHVYSDWMEASVVNTIAPSFIDAAYTAAGLAQSAAGLPDPYGAALASWLSGIIL